MKSKFSLLSLWLLIVLCFVVQNVLSQDSVAVRRIGISASLQSSQLDVLVPIWLGKGTIAPAIGIVWIEDVGTDLTLGLVARRFFSTNKVSPYIGTRICMLQAIPTVGTSTMDWLAGLVIGGEYFFDDHLSFGIETQLNLTFSDAKSSRFGNPGKRNFNTATALFATVYF